MHGFLLGTLNLSFILTAANSKITSIVDMHSHLGVDSVPALKGSDDTNSRKGIVQPWLRSLDGLNTHDDAYHLSISGGVTTANVLPGSANAIGMYILSIWDNVSLMESRWTSVHNQIAPNARAIVILNASRTPFHVERHTHRLFAPSAVEANEVGVIFVLGVDVVLNYSIDMHVVCAISRFANE